MSFEGEAQGVVHRGEEYILISFDPNDVLEYATSLSLPIQVTQEKDSRQEGISFVLQILPWLL